MDPPDHQFNQTAAFVSVQRSSQEDEEHPSGAAPPG